MSRKLSWQLLFLALLLVGLAAQAGALYQQLAAGKPVQLNAQPAGFATPPGYLPLTGAPYSPDRGYGWDQDMTFLERDRKISQSLLRSLVAIAHEVTHATLILDVPPGDYLLQVRMGDPAYPSHVELYVEGLPFPLASANLPQGATRVYPVVMHSSGGKLRLTFVAHNNHGGPGASLQALTIIPRKGAPEDYARALDLQHQRLEQFAAEQQAIEARRKAQRAAYRPKRLPSSLSPGEEFSLSGDWLFQPLQPGSDPSPYVNPATSDAAWHVLPVPGFWNQVGWWLYETDREEPGFRKTEVARCKRFTFDYQNTVTGVYREKFFVPAALEGKRLFARFTAVATVADVYCNGRKLAHHVGMFSPFLVELTPALQYGKLNLLAVVVDRLPPEAGTSEQKIGHAVTVELTQAQLYSLPDGMYNPVRTYKGTVTRRQKGLWGPVDLHVTGPVALKEWWFEPTLTTYALHLWLDNGASEPLSVQVQAHLADAESGRPLPGAAATFSGSLPPGLTEVVLERSGLQPKLWSPEQPNLYALDVKISTAQGLSDSLQRKVGFRTFTVKDNRFYLNGKPYYLRGANHAPNGLRPNDAALARRFMHLMHAGNELFTRTHASPYNDLWLSAADSEGVGVSLEGTWPWMLHGDTQIPSKQILSDWLAGWLDVIRYARNHPSVLMYTVNNEMYFWRQDSDPERRRQKIAVLSKAITEMRKIIPKGAPVVADSGYRRQPELYERFWKPYGYDDGDVDDVHYYTGWYNPSLLVQPPAAWEKVATGTRPLISQEFSTGYPDTDLGLPVARYLVDFMVAQAWVGRYCYQGYDPEYFLHHHAVMTKLTIERVRNEGQKTQGMLYFACNSWFHKCYDAKQITPYPTYHYAKAALAPVLVSLRHADFHFFANRAYSNELVLCNDDFEGGDLPAGEVRWAFRTLQGKLLQVGTMKVPSVKYFARKYVPFTFKTPKLEPGRRLQCRLWLAYYAKGRQQAVNFYDVLVADEAYATPPVTETPEIALLAATPGLKQALEPLGLKLFQVDDPADLSLDRPVVLDGATHLEEDALAALRNFVARGGKLLVLAAGDQVEQLLPGIVQRSESWASEFVDQAPKTDLLRKRLFAGLEPMDLKWWNSEGDFPVVADTEFVLAKDSEADPLAYYIRPHGYSRASYVKAHFSGTPLFAATYGKGWALVSAFRVDKLSDPLCQRLLANTVQAFCAYSKF